MFNTIDRYSILNLDKLQKLFSYCLVISIFLNVYSINGLGIGELLLMFIMPILIINKHSLNINKIGFLYLLYLLYCIFITFFNAICFDSLASLKPIIRLLRNGFYVFLVFYLGRNYFKCIYGIKMFRCLSIILSTMILLQFISFNLFGIYFSGLIKGLPISGLSATDIESGALIWISYTDYFRPNGFFSEPAHASYVLALALLLDLLPFDFDKDNKSIFRIGVYTISLLLTMSANAFFLLITVVVMYFLFSKKIGALKFFVILMAFISIILIVYNIIPYMNTLISRFINIGDFSETSSGLRVFRGPFFYYNLPLLSKVFGIGFGNFISARDYFNVWTIFEIEEEYMSSNWDYFVSVGLIGVIVLLYCAFMVLKNRTITNISIFLLSILIGFSASFSHSMIWALYMCLAFCEEKSYYFNKQFNGEELHSVCYRKT